ncbi:Prostaglandin F synthase [Hondaea fermentalgiana]|uniref:Prostaglandin F synthase n=1 Tax=Hondaea fermentalgiana TaxID=2315210 RepID=A0A2R5G3Q2_9STRA|nr:Prostaglandin F synthase [Hondaea fermentalgiana]|eukprot:GBG24949.1 Prostaglandin F synthase [Hondaea fermentalgiana]
MVGLGTWEYNNSVAYKATLTALKVGYVHVDTATMYGNHAGVGQAIQDWQSQNGGRREDIFVTTKIPGGLNYSAAEAALEASLKDLGLDYVDLMLVHFPAYWDGMGSAGPEATDDREFDHMVGTLYQSFSPLCGPCGTSELINGKLVTEIGKKYGKSGAQVSLKWQVQQGIPVIPKSDEASHIIANAQLFDWELSIEDMIKLDAAKSPPVTGGGDSKTSGDCKIP